MSIPIGSYEVVIPAIYVFQAGALFCNFYWVIISIANFNLVLSHVS
ncbi:MAG: hypothetical protein WCR21_05270 [Bacteroidota bacterium]